MSIAFSISNAVDWTGGTLLQGGKNALFSGVSIDTRAIEVGMLFIAIQGENHDAHEFLDTAIAEGAAGLLIQRDYENLERLPSYVAVIAVDDTTKALGALAAGHRSLFDGPVVAITGSNGKTSTKEMCAAILSVNAPCLKNEGNLNNQFGLPLTLLKRSHDHQRLVVEIGMNHVGEIAPLAAIARPTVAIITNVGSAHIGHMGSREIIAKEKGALIEDLPGYAAAVLNADDELVLAQASRTQAQVLTFGRESETADVRAAQIEFEEEGRFRFELITPEGRRFVRVMGLDETAISNALAAAAATQAIGASLDEIERGLDAYRPASGRMEHNLRPDGVTIINDTYNANPQSMQAALRSVSRHKGEQRAIAILGDMGELGEGAEEDHRAIGEFAARCGVDFLFALGDYAPSVIAGAQAEGLNPENAQVIQNHEEASQRAQSLVTRGDWVLVKGSRSMRMERIVNTLTAEEQ